jgi:site-specific recombinase XerD
VPPDRVVLQATAAAYLGRYRGASRLHTESDLRIFFNWCADQRLDPLTSVRADIERYVRWLQDVRLCQPSTVSRRLSVARMGRHAATLRLKRLAATAGIRMPRMHPYMLRHTFVTTMLDAGVSLRDAQIAARHADPRTTCATTAPARTSTATRTTSSPPTWHRERNRTARLCSTAGRTTRSWPRS